MSELIKSSNETVSTASAQEVKYTLTPARKGIGMSIAILSDLVLEVVPTPWGQVVDVITGVLLFFCLGARWELLPAFIVEMIPGVGCFPTWTAVASYIWLKGDKK